MKEKEYRAAEGLSGSQLGLLYSCPQKFKYRLENPKAPTDAMKWGTACHTAVLEPEVLSTNYAVAPEHCIDGRTKKPRLLDNKGLKGWTEFVEAAGGRDPLLYSEYQELLQIKTGVHSHPDMKKLFQAEGINEGEIFWEESGVKCKGRIDRYLTELNVIIDYKTSNDIGLDKFYKKVVYDFGYLLQLAHYQAGKKIALGLDSYPGILLGAQEQDAPYACCVYDVPQELIDDAHAKRREILEDYKGYQASGIWPSYDKGRGIVRLERV